jgi:hypothetical protein
MKVINNSILATTGLITNDVAVVNFLREFEKKFNVSDIEPLYYQGVNAGSEFETYSATKLYIALFLSASGVAQPTLGNGYIAFYDEGNALNLTFQNVSSYYNVGDTTVHDQINPILVKSFYFSRLQFSNYERLIFNGYKITL